MNHDIPDDHIAALLTRTTLSLPFPVFLRQVERTYNGIGAISAAEPILEGYEDANFLIHASSGTYVIKVFLKDRPLQNCKDYVRVMEESRALGVPVPRIVPGSSGLLGYAGAEKTPYMLTEFFDGQKFDSPPSLQDITQVAQYLALLNTLSFPVVSTYDSWGIRHFLEEYDQNGHLLNDEQRALLAPTVERMRSVDLSAFSQAVIHGDMQRRHVLKNDKGEYCIIDFGCMANDVKVIELAVYLAWYCLSEETWADRGTILKTVLAAYTEKHELSAEELAVLPLLTQVSYAAYFARTAVLLRQGDTSAETKDWHSAAARMLRLTKDWPTELSRQL